MSGCKRLINNPLVGGLLFDTYHRPFLTPLIMAKENFEKTKDLLANLNTNKAMHFYQALTFDP